MKSLLTSSVVILSFLLHFGNLGAASAEQELSKQLIQKYRSLEINCHSIRLHAAAYGDDINNSQIYLQEIEFNFQDCVKAFGNSIGTNLPLPDSWLDDQGYMRRSFDDPAGELIVQVASELATSCKRLLTSQIGELQSDLVYTCDFDIPKNWKSAFSASLWNLDLKHQFPIGSPICAEDPLTRGTTEGLDQFRTLIDNTVEAIDWKTISKQLVQDGFVCYRNDTECLRPNPFITLSTRQIPVAALLFRMPTIYKGKWYLPGAEGIPLCPENMACPGSQAPMGSNKGICLEDSVVKSIMVPIFDE